MAHQKTMSGSEFRAHFEPLLESLRDDDQIIFGAGDLTLYRLKERGPIAGPRVVQIEFNEIYSVQATTGAG